MTSDNFNSSAKRVEAKAGAAIPLETLRSAVEDHGRNCVAKLVKATGHSPAAIQQALKDAGLDPFAHKPKAFAGTRAAPKPAKKGAGK